MSSLDDLEYKVYPALRKKQLEVAFVEPQTMGIFTPFYRMLIPYVKVAPWKLIGLWAFILTVFLHLLLGSSFVSFASFLQKAF